MTAGPDALVLTLDRGNTTLDCRLRGPGVHERRRLAPTADGLIDFVGERRPDRVAGLSVVPGGLGPASRALAPLGLRILEAGHDLVCPLVLDYREPETLGVDRWVGAFAAHRAHGAAVTVDCGTAVTVNLVTADGRFRGGAIAPGVRTMARALAAAAPVLPEADLDALLEAPARSSQGAVELGVVAGFCGLVNELVDRVCVGAGVTEVVRVATGGDADVLRRHTGSQFIAAPELNHDGLSLLTCELDSKS